MKAQVGDIVEVMSIGKYEDVNEKYKVGARYRVIDVIEGCSFITIDNPHIQRKESFLRDGQYLIYKRPFRNWIKNLFT